MRLLSAGCLPAYNCRRGRETAPLRQIAPLRTPSPNANNRRATFPVYPDTPHPETLSNQSPTPKGALPFRAKDTQESDGTVRISASHLYLGIQPNCGEVTVTLAPTPNGN